MVGCKEWVALETGDEFIWLLHRMDLPMHLQPIFFKIVKALFGAGTTVYGLFKFRHSISKLAFHPTSFVDVITDIKHLISCVLLQR